MIQDCRACRHQLSPYLEGELPPFEKQAMYAHLAACSSCSAEFSALKGMLVGLKELPEPPVPADFRQAVWRKIDAPGWPERLKGWLLEPWYVKIPAEALAVTAVAFLVIYVFRPEAPPLMETGQATFDAFMAVPAAPSERKQASLKQIPISSMLAYEKIMAVAEASPPAGVPVHIRVQVENLALAAQKVAAALQELQPSETEHPSPARYHLVLPEEQYLRLMEALLEIGSLEISALETTLPDFPRLLRQERKRSRGPARLVVLELKSASTSPIP